MRVGGTAQPASTSAQATSAKRRCARRVNTLTLPPIGMWPTLTPYFRGENPIESPTKAARAWLWLKPPAKPIQDGNCWVKGAAVWWKKGRGDPRGRPVGRAVAGAPKGRPYGCRVHIALGPVYRPARAPTATAAARTSATGSV